MKHRPHRCEAKICHRDEEQQEEEDEEAKEDEEDEEEDENKPEPSPRQIGMKAVFLLVVGTAGCAILSDPLVDAVSNFSKVRSPSERFCQITCNACHAAGSLQYQ